MNLAELIWSYRETSFGKIGVLADSFFVRGIALVGKERASKHNLNTPWVELGREGSNPLIERTFRELQEYFAGERTSFTLPIKPEGTVFQQKVWRGLRQIPYGETCSYAELAAMIKSPKAVRAVGSANGKNPLPILIPCHRVIRQDGSLGGFSSGLDNKVKLLAIEQGGDIRALPSR